MDRELLQDSDGVNEASGTDLASSLRRDTFWKELGVAEGLDG